MKTVHVIFKTHLDIGFTGMAYEVMDQYKKDFIPKAIAAAYALNEGRDYPEFIWTTGAYLIWDYLRTESQEKVDLMEAAIKNGYIKWHGLPFTLHSELMDKRLFDFGLTLSKELDERFGIMTHAGKMTDVPGHTIGIVPSLYEAGIYYLHLGVNHASKVPDLPPLFRWRHPGGKEILVHYADGYGGGTVLDGFDHILHFAHSNDNQGPPSAEDISRQMEAIRDMYPGAKVVASTLDDYWKELSVIKDRFPLIDQEIGDTWIHGVGTDPVKVAAYKCLLGLRDTWMNEERMVVGSQEYKEFSLPLALVAEHTWGMDHKKFMADYVNYLPDELEKARKRNLINLDENPMKTKYISDFSQDEKVVGFEDKRLQSYDQMELSWREQRDYLTQAIGALTEDKRKEAREALIGLGQVGGLETQIHKSSGVPKEKRYLSYGRQYTMGGFSKIVFGPNGEIARIQRRPEQKLLHVSLGKVYHQIYTHLDYERYAADYNDHYSTTYVWSDADFGKPGLEFKGRISHDEEMFLDKIRLLEEKENYALIEVILRVPGTSVNLSGLPEYLLVRYEIRDGSQINIEVVMDHKRASRLPESMWVEMNLEVDSPSRWLMKKMETPLSCHDVVSNGNRYMHCLESIDYNDGLNKVSINSPTTPLCSIGGMNGLVHDNLFRDLSQGFYFNLYNNIWGTNFPAWIEGTVKSRLVVKWD